MWSFRFLLAALPAVAVASVICARADTARPEAAPTSLQCISDGRRSQEESELLAAYEASQAVQRPVGERIEATDALVAFLHQESRLAEALIALRSVTDPASPRRTEFELHEGFPGLLLAEAIIRANLAQFDDAIERLEEVSALDARLGGIEPHASFMSHKLLAFDLIAVGQGMRALGVVEAARLDPAATDMVRAEQEAELLLLQGRAFAALGDLGAAEAALRGALARRPALEQPDWIALCVSYELAQVLVSRGRIDDARPYLERVLARRWHPPGLINAIGDDQRGQELARLALFDEAAAATGTALALFDSVLGERDPRTVTVRRDLANIEVERGRFGEVARLYEQVMAAAELAEGASGAAAASSWQDMAWALAQMDRFEESDRAYRRALELRIALDGPESRSVAHVLEDHATLLREWGRDEPALRELGRAREIHMTLDGPHAFETARLDLQLALVYSDLDRYAEAIEHGRRGLQAYVEEYGTHDVRILVPMNDLALIYDRAGDNQTALAMLRDLTGLYETLPGVEPREYATHLSNLAVLLDARQEPDEVIALVEKALAIRIKFLGPGHSSVALSLNSLGLAYKDAGEPERAVPLLQRALAIDIRVYGGRSSYAAKDRHNLASALELVGEAEEAERELMEALSIRTELLGEQHSDTLMTLNNLALLRIEHGLGDREEAVRQFERIVTVGRTVFPPGHPDLQLWIANLAIQYRESGRYAEAEPLYREVLEVRQRQLGRTARDTIYVAARLGRLYLDMERYEDAVPLLQETVAARDELAGGPRESDLVSALVNLASAYQGLGRTAEADALLLRARQIVNTGHEGDHR